MPSRKKSRRAADAARDASLVRLLSEDRRRRRRHRGAGATALLAHLSACHHTEAVAARAHRLATALKRTRLLDPRGHVHDVRDGDTSSFAFGLAQLAATPAPWVRDPESWSARTHNVHRQFHAFCRHLLCRFDPPTFMDQAWFEPEPDHRSRHQSWFVLLGDGHSIRQADDLPITLTRRAAHVLMTEVPDGCTVRQGIRYAQCRALGAGPRLARTLLTTRMATDFERDAFWESVVRFFISHPTLDRSQVGPIVDYIDHRRHGSNELVPDEPGFSMRGRTPRTLLRQVERWHRRLGAGRRMQFVHWLPSGIPEVDRREGTGAQAQRFSIQEILNSRQLCQEGREMNHCVGSYVGACLARSVAIFAMRRECIGSVRHRLTIAVVPSTRLIVEARGKGNAMPNPTQVRLLRSWAASAKLRIGEGVLG